METISKRNQPKKKKKRKEILTNSSKNLRIHRVPPARKSGNFKAWRIYNRFPNKNFARGNRKEFKQIYRKTYNRFWPYIIIKVKITNSTNSRMSTIDFHPGTVEEAIVVAISSSKLQRFNFSRNLFSFQEILQGHYRDFLTKKSKIQLSRKSTINFHR